MLFRKPCVVVAIILIGSVLSYVQGSTFKKIRYQGGTVASTVKEDDWDNTLVVSQEEIMLILKDGNVEKIDPKFVTGLSYGQEAHRKVGTMILLGVLLTPIALFGLFHKTRKHYVGIEWKGEGDLRGGILLQADKDNYKGVLMALRGATGAPVSVSEEERKYVPIGIETLVTKTEEPKSEK